MNWVIRQALPRVDCRSWIEEVHGFGAGRVRAGRGPANLIGMIQLNLHNPALFHSGTPLNDD